MDLTSPKIIKEICSRFNFRFSKGLGQNFLLDSNVLDKIVQAAEIDGGVLEIGPGFGVLTQRLAENADKVVSVEIDKKLIPVLEYTLAEYSNTEIVEKDILKTDLHALIDEKFKGERISIAANLPYYITTPIITKLLETKLPVKNIVVMVQKEVAQRICAEPGKKDYGSVSVMCRYYTEPEIVTVVPAGSFMPPPKVDSAVLKMKVRRGPPVSLENEEYFFKIVRAAFGQRRKTLVNCLSNGLSIEKDIVVSVLKGCGHPPDIRGEKLSLEEFACIADMLYRKENENGTEENIRK